MGYTSNKSHVLTLPFDVEFDPDRDTFTTLANLYYKIGVHTRVSVHMIILCFLNISVPSLCCENPVNKLTIMR